MEDKKQIIASNLVTLRKNKGLTQMELAEKLNYSDKAISRWEHGDTLPDINMLCELCNFYGITLNDLVSENFTIDEENKNPRENILSYRAWLAALCVSVVWLLATITFVYSKTMIDKNFWIVFVWAVPLSCIMIRINVTSTLPNKDTIVLINSSILLWTTITSVYLFLLVYLKYTFLWPLYFVGVPIQTIIVIFHRMKQLRV